MRFTDRSIKALKAQEKRYIEWKDGGEGLGIRVTPNGRKTFVFMYRFDGRPRMMSLGIYAEPHKGEPEESNNNKKGLSLADANEAHAKARKLLEQGVDPGEKQVEANQESRSALTVKQLADEYIEKWAKPRKRSWTEDKRILDKDVLPAWKHRKARDITRRNVITLLDGIVERGSPIAANRTLAVTRKMFNFALSRDIIQATPCAAITAPAQEKQRDRILSTDEIKTFWQTLNRTGEGDAENLQMSDSVRLALKLQLLTAQRKGEVITAKWADIDTEAGWWTIPAMRSKNKLPHRVPLSQQAVAVLEQVKALGKKSDWVFPSPRGGKKPITSPAVDHALRNNRDIFGLADFTPHDLRRTAASQMTAMGISRLVVSKILNHVESGITAVYDRHSYDQEKRQALNAWGRKLDSILRDDKDSSTVVELRA